MEKVTVSPQAGRGAEERHSEAERRFQVTFDMNPAPSMIVRLADGVIVATNAGLPEISGSPNRDLLRRSVYSLELFVDNDLWRTLLETLKAGDAIPKTELEIYTLKEETRVVIAAAKPLELDDAPCAIFTFMDITEQKQAEERFTKAFRLVPIPVSISRLTKAPLVDHFVDVNDSFEALTGYSRAEVVGRSSDELGMWSSREDHDKLRTALKKQDSFRNLLLSIRTKTGAVRQVLGSVEMVEIGKNPAMLHIFYDVTEKRQSEAQLMQAIEAVMQDTSWFSQQVLERLAQIRSGTPDTPLMTDFTPRERQVLVLVAKGLNNNAIADELAIAQQTVRNYINRVYEKIGVHSRAEAVVWARERGLIGLETP